MTLSRTQLSDTPYYRVAEQPEVTLQGGSPGPVSPVSTGPLFTSPVACVASPIAQQMLTQGPQAHKWHVETCEMATNSVKELFQVFLSATLFF